MLNGRQGTEEYRGYKIICTRFAAPDGDTWMHDTEVQCPDGSIEAISLDSPTRWYTDEARQWIDERIGQQG